MTEEIGQDEKGQYTVTLLHSDGSTLFEKGGYLNEVTAHKASSNWLRLHYKPHQRRRAGVDKPTSTSGNSQILAILRTRAEDNASQAIRLRTQADLLEAEAKRLHAAADVLEGPELDG